MNWSEKIRSSLPTLDREMIRSLSKHGQWRKLLNYLIVNFQYARRDSFLIGYPFHLCIDPSSRCTLRCPICAVGNREYPKPMADMPLETFKRIMDELGPYLIVVELFLKGEPTMNKQIYEMISYCRRFNVSTRMSSNMQFTDTDAPDRLVDSGLELLLASVEGTTQETYVTYRRGGDLARALQNMRRIAEVKQRLKKTLPIVEWKFIVFRHNQHEIEEAKRMAADVGVDRLTFVGASVGADAGSAEVRDRWLPTDPRFAAYDNSGTFVKTSGFGRLAPACNLPWISVCIDPAAGVQTCCRSERPENDHGIFGDAFFWKTWNGKRYRDSRRYVRKDFSPSDTIDKSNLCAECPSGSFHSFLFRKPEHSQGFEEGSSAG